MADVEGKSEGAPENAQDLTIFVQNLLEQMVRKFLSCTTELVMKSFMNLAT